VVGLQCANGKRCQLSGELLARGLTLAEILVVVALASVIGVMGALQLPRLVASFRLASAAQQVVSVLHVARVRAIETTRQHRVAFQVGDRSYSLERREDDGSWSAVEGIKVLPEGISVLSANSGADLVFFPRGHCENGTVVLADPFGRVRKVILNQRGKVRLE